MRLLADEWLGAGEGDACGSRWEHVEVVRTVTDCHGAAERQPLQRRELTEGGRLAGAVDDLAHEATCQDAVADLEPVGPGMVDAELGRQATDDLDGHR